MVADFGGFILFVGNSTSVYVLDRNLYEGDEWDALSFVFTCIS